MLVKFLYCLFMQYDQLCVSICNIQIYKLASNRHTFTGCSRPRKTSGKKYFSRSGKCQGILKFCQGILEFKQKSGKSQEILK